MTTFSFGSSELQRQNFSQIHHFFISGLNLARLSRIRFLQGSTNAQLLLSETPAEAVPMYHEFYEVLFVGGSSLLALCLVRFRDRQRRRLLEARCMKRMLATVCK